MITIHQPCYNESLLLEFSYNFYKKRFPSAKFFLYDNGSTDNSVEIAKNLGYEVIHFETNNQMDDISLIELKNSCWKNDNTDWILACDVDELIDINENELALEERNGSTIISTYGFQMINQNNDFNLHAIKSGFRDDGLYDKSLIFNKKFIRDMKFNPGSHSCNPEGSLISFSTNRYALLHYKFINEDYIVNRYKELNNRRSQRNKDFKLSYHYEIEEQELRKYFREARNKNLVNLVV